MTARPKGQLLDWDNQALSEWRYRPASLKDIVRLIFQEESRNLAPDQQKEMTSNLAALESLSEEVLEARLAGIKADAENRPSR